jgi:multiple sugar transport system permease protein
MNNVIVGPRRWILLAIGITIAAFYLFPVYWMYVSSFKASSELNASPPTLLPQAPSLAAYVWIFTRENIARYLGNSLFQSASVTLLTLLLATGAAYALSRVRSLWMDAVLVGIMLSQVLPPALLVTPMFVIFRQIDLINTQTAVILATTTKNEDSALRSHHAAHHFRPDSCRAGGGCSG